MKFSIIVPVFKVEPYLCKCLDSILAQTITDFECVCVDDGSPDNCGTILDEYAAKDTRIRVLHQENKGVSAARQVGLNASRGDWINFVDSDDWVDPDMLERYNRFVESHDCEFVWCNYGVHDNDKFAIWKQDFPEDPVALVRAMLEGKYMGFCTNKMIARTLLERAKAKFPPYYVTCWEDMYFILQCLAQKPKVGYMDTSYYHYLIHDDSPLHLCRPAALFAKARLIGDFEKIVLWPEMAGLIRGLKQRERLSAFLNPKMSRMDCNNIFPEITHLDETIAKWWTRLFFKCCIIGLRPIALPCFLTLRKLIGRG